MNDKQKQIIKIIKKRFSGKMPIKIDHELVLDLILNEFKLNHDEEDSMIEIMVNENIIKPEVL